MVAKEVVLFPPASDNAINPDYEEGQSLEEFVDMGKRRPNKSGTGRYKLTAKRNKILVIYFGSEKTKSLYEVTLLVNFLEKFLLLDIDYKNCYDAIDIKSKTFTFNGAEYDIDCKKGKKNEYPSVKVSSLLNVLVNDTDEPYYTVVGLFENRIIDDEDDVEVLGRAWNDRVCCVSLPYCQEPSSLLATTAHELLHNFGIDHNDTHRCLMNAIVANQDWLFLCQENIEKLKVIHEELKSKSKHYVSLTNFYLDYHQGLLEVLAGNKKFKVEAQWLQDVIAYYSDTKKATDRKRSRTAYLEKQKSKSANVEAKQEENAEKKQKFIPTTKQKGEETYLEIYKRYKDIYPALTQQEVFRKIKGDYPNRCFPTPRSAQTWDSDDVSSDPDDDSEDGSNEDSDDEDDND
jgi:hypothetical protein